MRNGTEVDLLREFHNAVKALAVDTVEVFKDNKRVRKMLKKGNYDDVVEYVFSLCILQPEFDNDSILDASEEGVEGLQALAVDAAYIDMLLSLSVAWTEVNAAMTVMPSLTWPKGIKFGT